MTSTFQDDIHTKVADRVLAQRDDTFRRMSYFQDTFLTIFDDYEILGVDFTNRLADHACVVRREAVPTSRASLARLRVKPFSPLL
jgi:hypothetical protein